MCSHMAFHFRRECSHSNRLLHTDRMLSPHLSLTSPLLRPQMLSLFLHTLTPPSPVPHPATPGPAGAFDSHICFAAASPISRPTEEWIYYMGGDGPHSGDRDSAMGLATMRKDGFASLSGTGSVTTVALTVTGATLRVTADFSSQQGMLRLGVSGPSAGPLDPSLCDPVTSNSTDAPVSFHAGANFSALVGRTVALRIEMQDAIVYTFGWG